MKKKKAPSPKKRTKAQKEKDKSLIAKLYLRGLSFRRIAEELCQGRPYTLSHVQIKADIDGMLKEWRSEMFDDLTDLKTTEVQKLNKVESEAWLAYDRTKENQNSGDNRSAKFLDIIIKCIEKRCKIFGIEEVPEIYAEKQIVVVKLPSQEEGYADSDGEKTEENI